MASTLHHICNLFSEALHWIFETLLGWNLTHYLDDFLFVFEPDSDPLSNAERYNNILTIMGLSRAPEKDMDEHIVIHLGFKIDSEKMEVCLPLNKKLHALDIIKSLLYTKSVSHTTLDEALAYLVYCC